jgi:hypothetical protein
LKLVRPYFSGFAVALVHAFPSQQLFVRGKDADGEQAVHADRFDFPVTTVYMLEMRTSSHSALRPLTGMEIVHANYEWSLDLLEAPTASVHCV